MKSLRAVPPVVIGLLLAAGGCASVIGADFDRPAETVSAEGGSSTDLVESPVPPSADGACAADRKLCNGLCVSKADPAFGCGDDCQPCSIPHAVAGCHAGACVIRTCDVARADCNLNMSDGCEVAIDSDPANCGGCARACTSGSACAKETCTTPSSSCNAASCAGCCSGNQCVPGDTKAACGSGGSACDVCQAVGGRCFQNRCALMMGACNKTGSTQAISCKSVCAQNGNRQCTNGCFDGTPSVVGAVQPCTGSGGVQVTTSSCDQPLTLSNQSEIDCCCTD
jgi:hypothetical protein